MRNDVSTPTPRCCESHVWCMCGSSQEFPNLLVLNPADQPRVILRKCFIAQTVLHRGGDVTHQTNPRQVVLVDALERNPSMPREHLWRWCFSRAVTCDVEVFAVKCEHGHVLKMRVAVSQAPVAKEIT